MKHPSEIALHQYLDDATNGKSSMSAKTIAGIKKDIGKLSIASSVKEQSVESFSYGCQI